MKLTAKTDIGAPASAVYAMLIDHPHWENDARRRGAEIERPPGTPPTGVGAAWRIRVPFRGKERNILLRIDAATPDTLLSFVIEGQAIEGNSALELVALSPRRTRLRLVLEIRPRTLGARLFINTLRLAKGRVQARLEKRLAQMAAQIELRQARSPAPAARG